MNERPSRETFGENLGDLTSEIFGYELGNEPRTILRSYIDIY